MPRLSISLRAAFYLALLVELPGDRSAAAAPDWENEQIVHRHRLPPRATFWPLQSVADALAYAPSAAPSDWHAESPWVRPLAGDWQFHWAATPADKPAWESM
jgi:beta-galactosidase